MPMVFLPAILRPLAGGAATVSAAGATLREVIADLERQHEGLRGRVVDAGGVRPEVFLAIDGEESFSLDQPVAPEAQVHVMPAMAGG
jgi:molybdopterin synthase sulfur carrier subunit